MELIFETVGEIGSGSFPDFVQFEKTEGELFFIDGGLLYGKPSDKFNGDFSSPDWYETEDITPPTLSAVSNLELKTLSGFGIVGSLTTPTSQKLLIYEFQHDISEYLNSGTIKHTIDDPISSFTLSLENPDIQDPERPGNIAINEDKGLLNPGGKIQFFFGAGDEEPEFEMGTLYIDRSDFTLASETASVDGRNTIGKVLGDQTVDENNEYWYAAISENIKKLLEAAGIKQDYYLVENTSEQGWFSFTPNTTYLKALEGMLETLPTWEIKELSDGTIVIGSPTFSGFDSPGIYTFYRDKDIFSRQITRDDAQSYRRVCVHTENFEDFVYRDVEGYSGWNLQANKTLYIQVSSGLRRAMLATYADELALRLKESGKLESFTGPFRPHLQNKDEAIIIGQNGSVSLGLITEITHKIGKSGFGTDFTVDSGGTVGKGRLSDYIKKITTGTIAPTGDSGWGDIDYDEYINLAIGASVVVSSTKSMALPPSLLNDNKMYTPDDQGWSPDTSDLNPFIEVIFGSKTSLDTIKLYFGYDDPATDPATIPDYYKIEYYNYDTKAWVHLLTADKLIAPIEFTATHGFSAVTTSRLRFTLKPKALQRWREIQILGFL